MDNSKVIPSPTQSSFGEELSRAGFLYDGHVTHGSLESQMRLIRDRLTPVKTKLESLQKNGMLDYPAFSIVEDAMRELNRLLEYI